MNLFVLDVPQITVTPKQFYQVTSGNPGPLMHNYESSCRKHPYSVESQQTLAVDRKLGRWAISFAHGQNRESQPRQSTYRLFVR